MKDLQNLFEQKKIESEFENTHSPSLSDENFHEEALLRELKTIHRKQNSCDRQADQLEYRIRDLQKKYYDDMKIIDINYKTYDGEVFPWRSKESYTRDQYVYWDINPEYLILTQSPIYDVAIRKAGNEKQIAVLDNICKRIQALDNMKKILAWKKTDIKQQLNTVFGHFPTDPSN